MDGAVLWIVAWVAAIVVGYFGYAFLAPKHPMLTESDYSHRICPLWEVYYGQKYVKPARHAYRGSGFEQHFAENRRPEFEPLADSRTVTLAAVGDLMTRRDLIKPGSPHLWDLAGPFVFGADHSSGNLEFAVNPAHIIEKTVRYSVTPAHAEPLLSDPRFGRFNLVYTANNHINDSHFAGITSTLNYLDSVGVRHVGAARTPAEQDAFPIVDVKGVKVAFLAYAFTHNGVEFDDDKEFGMNLVRFNALRERDYDPSLIHRHVRLARERGAELIVASHHWSVEFEYYPPQRIVRRARDLMDAGVDIIIGHHPHVLNPSEWYHTKDGREALCFYSLGNFTTVSLIYAFQHLSQAVKITVEQGLDAAGRRVTRPRGAQIMPTYFRRHKVNGVSDNRLIPLLSMARDVRDGRAPDWLTATNRRVVLKLEREYRRYFLQQHAFDYV